MYVLRVWVKRPAGWRILHYHEVVLAGHPAASALSANDCENPCKDVPYTPKDDAEKGIRTSWAGLELALTDHDTKAWTPHFPEEYLMATSGATGPITKADRIATISKPGGARVTLCRPMWVAGKLCESQLALEPPAKFFHFGDTVVIISRNKPYYRQARTEHSNLALDHDRDLADDGELGHGDSVRANRSAKILGPNACRKQSRRPEWQRIDRLRTVMKSCL